MYEPQSPQGGYQGILMFLICFALLTTFLIGAYVGSYLSFLWA